MTKNYNFHSRGFESLQQTTPSILGPLIQIKLIFPKSLRKSNRRGISLPGWTDMQYILKYVQFLLKERAGKQPALCLYNI